VNIARDIAGLRHHCLQIARLGFSVVVTPLTMQQYMLLQRNLVYTGITRGRKLVVLVGQRKALAMAVQNNWTEQRFSGLLAKERLTNRAVQMRDGAVRSSAHLPNIVGPCWNHSSQNPPVNHVIPQIWRAVT
jgi:UvrD-like helicase C-terminal domain